MLSHTRNQRAGCAGLFWGLHEALEGSCLLQHLGEVPILSQGEESRRGQTLVAPITLQGTGRGVVCVPCSPCSDTHKQLVRGISPPTPHPPWLPQVWGLCPPARKRVSGHSAEAGGRGACAARGLLPISRASSPGSGSHSRFLHSLRASCNN